MGNWSLNSGLLQEQYVLLIEQLVHLGIMFRTVSHLDKAPRESKLLAVIVFVATASGTGAIAQLVGCLPNAVLST